MRGIDLGQLFVPRWGATGVERDALRCLKRCLRQLGLQEIPLPVPVEEWIETVFDIRFGVADLSHLGDYVLGAGFIKHREILISDKITDLDGRFRFTCAHELGHFVLHAKRQEIFQDTEVEQPFQSVEFEREADRFAAAFLIPIALLERELFAICERRRLNEVQCLKRLIRPTVESHWLWRKVFLPEITKRFGVSVSAAVYHLHDEDSQQAMRALAGTNHNGNGEKVEDSSEGILRAVAQSTIEKTPQVPEVQELVACLSEGTERGGYRGTPSPPISGCHFRLHTKP